MGASFDALMALIGGSSAVFASFCLTCGPQNAPPTLCPLILSMFLLVFQIVCASAASRTRDPIVNYHMKLHVVTFRQVAPGSPFWLAFGHMFGPFWFLWAFPAFQYGAISTYVRQDGPLTVPGDQY
jgi:hypothetical protein